MTIAGWIIFSILALAFVGGGIGFVFYFESKSARIASVLTGVILTAVLLLGMTWYYSSTEAGKRALKDQESNIKGGIERTVQVFDMEGELIKEYTGEFDVEMHDTYILFDDDNGQRHIIYFTTGTVIIDEN